MISGEDLERAGDTIAFTAQRVGGVASGQATYVGTSGAGAGMDRWQGVVTCLEVDGNTAEIGGEIHDTQGGTVTGRFAIWVRDNGPPAAGADLLLISSGEDTEGNCDEDFGDLPQLTLARGNVTVHDAGE